MENFRKAFINKSDEKFETQGTAIREKGTAIWNLERQLGQIANMLSERTSRTLPADTEKNPKETIKVVSSRSGKTLADPVVKARPEIVSKQAETPVEKNDEEQKGQRSGVQREIEESRHMLALPFPQNMKREKLDKCFGRFLEMLKKLYVNIPFTEMNMMMKYASDEASAYSYFKMDMVEDMVENYKFDKLVGDTLERCITQSSTVEDEDPEIKREDEALETENQVVDEKKLKEEASMPNVELKLVELLKKHKKAIGWSIADIQGISPAIFIYKILWEENIKPVLQPQRKLNKNLEEVVHKEIIKLLDARCHFMVKEGIVLGHEVTTHGIEVERSKVDVIARLPPPTSVKGIRSFLGHVGFYRRFIKNFSSITKPLTALLAKDAKFDFNVECLRAFQLIK
ncbi:uncharacterized protein [Nicotiana tomentosiformis]|uniref:uncharacterized protein n=1 Tax=Nicotiana tomentosiformis TaxID=4098 RepID=UPI00388C7739